MSDGIDKVADLVPTNCTPLLGIRGLAYLDEDGDIIYRWRPATDDETVSLHEIAVLTTMMQASAMADLASVARDLDD